MGTRHERHTLNTKTFISRPEHYQRNYEDGENLRVGPATLGYEGGTTPGVAIFIGKSFPVMVLTAEHAWKLADQLADILDSLTEDTAA